MEIIGEGLKAIGSAVGAIATAYAFIYIAGIGTKTFLIYTGKATAEELKNWFDFVKKGGGNKL
jgi:short-subunit dehydrogenase